MSDYQRSKIHQILQRTIASKVLYESKHAEEVLKQGLNAAEELLANFCCEQCDLAEAAGEEYAETERIAGTQTNPTTNEGTITQ